MIQLSALMWTAAIFFALIGFLRGWNRELLSSAGILLAVFALFQFDGLLRGTVFLAMRREQIFFLQAVAFLFVVFVVYQARELESMQRRDDDTGAGFLGALVGAFNGYLIVGSLWYFLDINEYPLSQFMVAPAVNSPSGDTINLIPLVLVGGGTSGTGDLLAVGVIVLLFFLLMRV